MSSSAPAARPRSAARLFGLHVPAARGEVMEPNQVDVVTGAVSGGFEQILHAGEARFARQIVGDIRQANRPDRLHDNLPLVHAIAAARLDMGPLPDADAALDSPAPD